MDSICLGIDKYVAINVEIDDMEEKSTELT